MILNPGRYCIPLAHGLLGQTTKQTLSNFEPRKLWKNKQLSGLTPDPSCLSKKLSVMDNCKLFLSTSCSKSV